MLCALCKVDLAKSEMVSETILLSRRHRARDKRDKGTDKGTEVIKFT